jgi:hypothetical protein
MYSLFGCCIASDVNPQEWHTDVLTRIPGYNAEYTKDVAALLSYNWKQAHPLIASIEIKIIIGKAGICWKKLKFSAFFYNNSKNPRNA